MSRRLLLSALILIAVTAVAVLMALGHPQPDTAGGRAAAGAYASAERPREDMAIGAAGGLVSVEAERVPVRRLLLEASRAAHLPFHVDVQPGSLSPAHYERVPALAVIAQVVKAEGLGFDRRPDGIHIAPRADCVAPLPLERAVALAKRHDYEPGTTIFRPKDRAKLREIIRDLRRETGSAITLDKVDSRTDFVKISFPQAEPVLNVITALMRDGRVDSPEANYHAYALGYVPDDPDYGQQWHLEKIRCPEAWDVTKGQRLQQGAGLPLRQWRHERARHARGR